MKYIINIFNTRNFKKIPYFFTRNQSSISQNNYALIGKLSTSLLHDVLSPLTSLMIANDITETHSSEAFKPLIQNSSSQIKEYVEIMREFLQEEYTTNKKILINTEVQKCLTLLKNKIIQNNIQINFIEFDQIYIKINPLYIYQIIINLLTNAIEASTQSETKKIILILRKNKKDVIIECKDFGTGIPKEILQKIGSYNFSTKSNNRGFGLYSIYQLIVHILGGTVSTETEEGAGSLFTCTLPLTK